MSSPALPFTCALFDLDGCLLDTNDLIQRSFQHTFAECAGVLGLREPPAASLIQSWFGEPLVTTFRRFSQDEATVAHCVAAYRAFNLAQHDALAREFDGLLAVVRHLSQCGVRLAVVTSKASHAARLGLERARMTPYFPVLIAADSVTHHKPHAEPALAALAALGVAPGPHVLFIGDAITDHQCGRAAGLRTALVGWSTFPRAALEAVGPDFFPATPAELHAVLLPPRRLASGHFLPAGPALGTWRSDPALVEAIVEHAIVHAGVRHIDTARMYFNERLVGRGVAAAIASGAVARSDLFIATKLMPSEMHPDRVASLVDESLAALATPYIDLFMLHWPYQIAFQPKTFPVPMDERMGYSVDNVRAMWRALEAQVALGKIRSLGVSNFSCTRLTDTLLAGDAEFKLASPPVCNQLEIHAYLSQARQCEWHSQRCIVVTTYSPLGSPARPSTCRHEDEDDEKDASSPFVELLQHPAVAAVAARTQRSAAQVLLRWALQRGTVPLPKTVTPARAEQNALVYGWALGANDMAAIDALHCDRRFIRGDNHCAAGESWQGTWAERDGVL